MRITVVAAICLCIIEVSTGADAQAAIRRQTNIPAQGLGPALQVLAKDRNLQVVYRSEVIGKLRTSGAAGQLTTDEAVTELLRGTGLTFRYLAENAITITPVGSKSDAVSSPTSSTATPSVEPNATDQQPQEGKKSVWGNVRLAQATGGTVTSDSSIGNRVQGSSSSPQLEEVVVTAEKKSERLQDVPLPISVLSTQELQENDQTALRDYYNEVPGLAIHEVGSVGSQLVVIRGITTGGAGHDPTVGIALDDVPFGSVSSNSLPDIDPADLERIEVLRGPQGTLYGADSMGGLIRYVTKDPTTDSLNGSVTAGTSIVQNGAETGYNFHAAVNVPLTSDLAMRVSGYVREVPGYVDNPVLGIRGINEDHADGGNITLKWTPSDSFSLKLRAMYQLNDNFGSPDVGIGLGDLQQEFIPGVGGLEYKTQLYSAVMNAKLGAVDLTSVTAYSFITQHDSFDYTDGFGPLAEAYFQVPYAPVFDYFDTHKFSQEFRFSGSIGPALDWLGGAFYTYEKGPNGTDFDAETTGGVVKGAIFSQNNEGNYREYAVFGTLTYRFTDEADLQLGGRESHIETHSYYVSGGEFYPMPVFTENPVDSNNAFTYSVTPRFKISPDLMAFARVATGYRPGGTNGTLSTPAMFAHVPAEFDPDKTTNYEIGLKTDLLDHKLSIDTSLYYIDWKDIQVSISRDGYAYTANAGTAKSEGVELSLEARPWSGLTVASWVAYDDAALTQNAPLGSVYGPAGARLPYSSRWSGNVSAQQEFPLVAAVTGFVGAQAIFVGDRLGVFAPTAAAYRQDYPSYTQVNLRAGAKYGPWTANLFANNATNRRGLIGGGAGDFPANAYEYIQPRTVGVNFTRMF